MDMTYFTVAGGDFEIEGDLLKMPFFNNYAPFFREKRESSDLFFSMTFAKLPGMKRNASSSVFTNDSGVYTINFESDKYDVLFRMTGSPKEYRLRAHKGWSKVEVDIDVQAPEDLYVLSDFIMLAFVYSSALYNTILLHASCIKHGDDAVAFVGQSGVGKSTHSQLWMRFISGSQLLNDDQPAVRLIDGKAWIFGTPWSGKTSCYVDEKAVLKTIFVMEQAKKNEVLPLSPLVVFQHLLTSASMMREDNDTFDDITKTLAVIAQNVKGYRLRTLPEQAAADLSYSVSIGAE